jgi:hypothetical protein
MADSIYLFDGRANPGAQKHEVDSSTGSEATLSADMYLIYVTGADIHFVLYTTTDGGSAPSVTDFTASATAAAHFLPNGAMLPIWTKGKNRLKMLTETGDAVVFLTPVNGVR